MIMWIIIIVITFIALVLSILATWKSFKMQRGVKGDTNLQSALLLFRHGQKGPDTSDVIQDSNPSISCYIPRASACNMYYFYDAISTDPAQNSLMALPMFRSQVEAFGPAWSNLGTTLSQTGYEQGQKFIDTVESAIATQQLTSITKALILSPIMNANSYVTAFPLLQKLVHNGSLRTILFFDDSGPQPSLIPPPDGGSLLLVADAAVFGNPMNLISTLNQDYQATLGTPSRGREVYVYTMPNNVRVYTQIT
jgi:hypothetical protein